MILSRLRHTFDLTQTIFYEGRLYEKLTSFPGQPKYKYRVILAMDDYDYVVLPALRKRLDRAFKRASKF